MITVTVRTRETKRNETKVVSEIKFSHFWRRCDSSDSKDATRTRATWVVDDRETIW